VSWAAGENHVSRSRVEDGRSSQGVRPRGARLWRVLVVGGMALAAACAGTQKGSQGTGSTEGSGQTGSSAGGGGESGGGAGGW
jgi:hypothetical protein